MCVRACVILRARYTMVSLVSTQTPKVLQVHNINKYYIRYVWCAQARAHTRNEHTPLTNYIVSVWIQQQNWGCIWQQYTQRWQATVTATNKKLINFYRQFNIIVMLCVLGWWRWKPILEAIGMSNSKKRKNIRVRTAPNGSILWDLIENHHHLVFVNAQFFVGCLCFSRIYA